MGRRWWKKASLIAAMGSLITVGYAFKEETKPKNTVGIVRKDSASIPNNDAENVYALLGLEVKGLAKDVFLKAWNGFEKLNSSGLVKKPVLAIADMSQRSCNKRLYIIDMVKRKLLVNTLVAHGKNSGDAVATRFSNISESLQTSLGFYITGDTYQGNNGYSMRLQGLEKGFNDLAESRAIVMHGAPYVNESIAKSGRIGRSWGCPAVSQKEHRTIIDLVKNGSCLFVYAKEKKYLAQSALAKSNTNNQL
jgi:hypothetical protein